MQVLGSRGLFQFLKRFFSNDILIELSKNTVSIKQFGSVLIYEDEPYIAIEKTNKGDIIQAIGAEAKKLSSGTMTVSNPFQHSRSFVADFLVAAKLIIKGIALIQ